MYRIYLPEIDWVLELEFGDSSAASSTSDPVAVNSSNTISSEKIKDVLR